MVPVYLHCECGRSYKFRTNMDALQFTAKCPNCGSPVEMELNKNWTAYVVMGSENTRRKK